jgi:hypothetical protein
LGRTHLSHTTSMTSWQSAHPAAEYFHLALAVHDVPRRQRTKHDWPIRTLIGIKPDEARRFARLPELLRRWATAALELNRNSTPVTSRKPHRRSRSTEPAIPSAGAAHLYHRLTITTLRLGAWTLMLRARAALSAAGPCSLGSMDCPLCKPSTAMAAKCCSTFRRKLVFRESPCLCSRETD